MSAIDPSASLVVLRMQHEQLEVLLLRRSSELSFAADHWVFPGGRIDPQDYPHKDSDVLPAARAAAIREAQEEAGLDISGHDLLFFSHWITPETFRKRFATWFFITELKGSQSVVVDQSEMVDHRWCTPQQALAAHKKGEMLMMPPTFITLTELAGCGDCYQAINMYQRRGVFEFAPKDTRVEAGRCMLYGGDAGYEAADPNAAGPRHRLWLKKDGWQYSKQ